MKAPNPKKDRRIFWISACILLIPAVSGWMRFQQTLRHWYYLIDLKIWPHPIYIAISGGLMGILFTLALIFHFSRFSFTRGYLQAVSIAFLTWLWIDRIFIGIQESFRLLLAGTILITVLLIGFDIFIFKKNAYLKEAGDHVRKN